MVKTIPSEEIVTTTDCTTDNSKSTYVKHIPTGIWRRTHNDSYQIRIAKEWNVMESFARTFNSRAF